MGLPADAILHVGDDWSADVVGGRRAGWRVAYLATGQPDSPFPASQPSDDVEPDLRLERLADLEVALAIAAPLTSVSPRTVAAHREGAGG